MKKFIGLLLSLVLVIGMLAACGSNAGSGSGSSGGGSSNNAGSGGSSNGGKKIRIGVTHFSYSIPQVQAVIRAQQEAAAELGVELLDMDSQGDAQKQTQQLNNFLVQKVDALILEPIDPQGVIPVIQKFKDAGIPVINTILPLDEVGMEYVDTFIGVNNIQDGKDAAELMRRALPNGGKVVVIEGAPGTVTQMERTQGFEEGLAGTNIEIVEKQASPWDRTTAMNIMKDFLIKYPDLDGVFCHSDDMCMGVLQAIREKGKIGQIQVIGHDGSQEAVDAIKAGEMFGTVVELLLWEGQMSVEIATKAAKGEPIEKRYAPPRTLLTIDNINEYEAAF